MPPNKMLQSLQKSNSNRDLQAAPRLSGQALDFARLCAELPMLHSQSPFLPQSLRKPAAKGKHQNPTPRKDTRTTTRIRSAAADFAYPDPAETIPLANLAFPAIRKSRTFPKHHRPQTSLSPPSPLHPSGAHVLISIMAETTGEIQFLPWNLTPKMPLKGKAIDPTWSLLRAVIPPWAGRVQTPPGTGLDG